MTPSIAIDISLIITAYLLGSIPFGIIASSLFNLEDPRTQGSGSIGATNVLRQGHKGAAFFTLLLDTLKGSSAVLLASLLDPPLAQIIALLVVIGHIWPVWLGFRGGKGVATALGAILILSWPLAVICLVTWLVMALTTRYSSLASLTSILLSPLYAIVLERTDLVILSLVFLVLLIWTHRSNIGRLLTGRETKIGESNFSTSLQD